MNKEVYLDNASTTKVDERVYKKMKKYFLENYGNPSSMHSKGVEAKKVIEDSREIIAKKINADSKEIIFTGSGTEANNLAVKGLFLKNYPEKNHIITTKIEHDCILNSCKWVEKQGGKVSYLNVDREGFVDLNELKKSITEKTFLVSVIHGNNEIGTIQDLKEIGKICREKGVLFHTDACQSFTHIQIDVKKENIDLVTLNAHKIHGPKGVGALYIREGIELTPLLHGGGQEFGKRSSTENIHGIVGFAEAVKISSKNENKNIQKLRDYLIKEILKISNTKLNGSIEKRLCNSINFSFKNIEGEAIVSLLSIKKICVSTGSACSSNSLEPSHVLLAMGLNPVEANSSIRISLSKYNTKKEVDYFIEELKKVVEHLRRISPLR
jgi:cysteine desulfurase